MEHHPTQEVTAANVAVAHTKTHIVQNVGVCHIPNFGFESGESISKLSLHYSTLGTPQHDAAGLICNAVLLLHSSTANRLHWTSGQLGRELYGPGQPLDASKYFIVIPDLIGHGQSSKPSDGLRMQFPRYQCRDVVKALYLMTSQGFHIQQFQLVMGTSLGAMLVWLWGQMYPDASLRLLPIGSYPLALGGRNWIMRRMVIEAIRNDPTWSGGNYSKPPTHCFYTVPLLLLMGHGVQQLQDAAPNRKTADRYYEKLTKIVAQYDANDLLYILESTQDYDPSPGLEKIKAKVLAINFSDDEMWPHEMGEVEAALKRLPDTQFVLVPASRQSCGHLTYYQPAMWKAHLVEFLG